MLSHQGVEVFERIRRIRKCVLVGVGVSLGVDFEVLKAHARPSLSLSQSVCLFLSTPLACASRCSYSAMHATLSPPTP